MYMTKFQNLPNDSDTIIKYQSKIILDGLDALYQIWSWDSIMGESIIFTNDDISGNDITELEKKIRIDYPQANNSSITTKDSEDYFFINFNFQTF
jgi:hypothetical protein